MAYQLAVNIDAVRANTKKNDLGAGNDGAALPIDSHRSEILHRINSDRVTIIHGETGKYKLYRNNFIFVLFI